VVGPYKMPSSPEDVDLMIERLTENDLGSPYQVAYLFFIALLRHSDMAGDRMNETRKATTFKLFQKTLHPGCFIDDPKNPTEKKIRKHTRAAINRVVGNPCMARCYFVGANPLNNYNTDYSNLTVKFQGGLGYKRDEGCSSEIAVFCEGQTPMEGVPQVRIIILEFFEGKWWVKIVTKILISPIEPFYISEEVTPDLSVPDEEDIEREQGYRRVKGLPPMELPETEEKGKGKKK